MNEKIIKAKINLVTTVKIDDLIDQCRVFVNNIKCIIEIDYFIVIDNTNSHIIFTKQLNISDKINIFYINDMKYLNDLKELEKNLG